MKNTPESFMSGILSNLKGDDFSFKFQLSVNFPDVTEKETKIFVKGSVMQI